MGRFSPKTATGMTSSRRGVDTWLSEQPQSKAIVHRALQRPARPSVAAMVATVVTTATAAATVRPIRRVAVATAVVAGPVEVAVQGRAGRVPVRPSRTRLTKWPLSRQSARLLKKRRRQGQKFGIAFYVTLGMTGKVPPNNCTIYSRRLVSRFGSAKRILVLVCR